MRQPYSLVRLTHDIGIWKAGSRGTIVEVYAASDAYCLEMSGSVDLDGIIDVTEADIEDWA